jgi:hypothetical protein
MKTLTLIALAATLLLSAGCSGVLPLENAVRSRPDLAADDSDQPTSGSASGHCAGNITLASCKAVPAVPPTI